MGPIRYIFPAFVVAMWIVCGVGLADGQWLGFHWVLLGLAHLACAIIFFNFVYVFSYGYGVSMMLANLGVMAWRPVPAALLVGSLGLVYGLRLVWFVHARYGNQSYASLRAKGERANAGVPLPLRLFMWVSCGWLMTFLVLPTWIAAESGAVTTGILAGAGLMLVGLLLEAVADAQKQAAKATNPTTFIATGLYGRLRHPNYLGEIVFQLGLLVAAIAGAPGAWALAAGVLGPAYIVILMYYAARDQDRQQAARYGNDPAYGSYRQKSSSLLPGL